MILFLYIESSIYPKKNENLLPPTKLSLEQNNQVMKELNLIQ